MNKPVIASAVLALLAGCPLLDVEVEVPEVCLTYAGLEVEAVHGNAGMPLHRTFAIDDLDAIHQITDLDADVSFVRAELLALSGIDDFAFVDAARITLTSEGTGLPPLVLYACDGDCVTSAGALDMTAATRHDALAHLRGDSLAIDVELSGTLPATAWSMDVDVCFAASARYTY